MRGVAGSPNHPRVRQREARGRGRDAGRVRGVQHAVALDHAVAGLVGRGAPLEVEAGRGQREALHLLWRGFRR